MDTDTYLEQRLAELERQRIEITEALRIITEKLKKADARRASELGTEHFGKWRDILQTLEGQLNDSRSHLSAVEAEIHDKRQKLEELREKARAEAERTTQIIERIKTMTVDELGMLSVEELAVLQAYELSHGAITEDDAAVETANAVPVQEAPAQEPVETTASAAAPPQEVSPEPGGSSREARLAGAIRKAFSGHIEGLTFEEVGLLISFHTSLRQQPEANPSTARYLEIVSGAIQQARRVWAQLEAQWEQTRG